MDRVQPCVKLAIYFVDKMKKRSVKFMTQVSKNKQQTYIRKGWRDRWISPHTHTHPCSCMYCIVLRWPLLRLCP